LTLVTVGPGLTKVTKAAKQPAESLPAGACLSVKPAAARAAALLRGLKLAIFQREIDRKTGWAVQSGAVQGIAVG
jgi:hypothetical protein